MSSIKYDRILFLFTYLFFIPNSHNKIMKYPLITHFISILKKTTSSQHVLKTKEKNHKKWPLLFYIYYSSDEKYPFPIFTIKKKIIIKKIQTHFHLISKNCLAGNKHPLWTISLSLFDFSYVFKYPIWNRCVRRSVSFYNPGFPLLQKNYFIFNLLGRD